MFHRKKKKRNDESKRNLLIFNWRVRFTVEDLRYSQVRQIHTYTRNMCVQKSLPIQVVRSWLTGRFTCVQVIRGVGEPERSEQKKKKKEKERKNPGRVKRYQSEGEGTRWRFVKRERHVQLNPYKAKLFIHYSLFILLFANEPKDF